LYWIASIAGITRLNPFQDAIFVKPAQQVFKVTGCEMGLILNLVGGGKLYEI
jgi:hypothetical protein